MKRERVAKQRREKREVMANKLQHSGLLKMPSETKTAKTKYELAL